MRKYKNLMIALTTISFVVFMSVGFILNSQLSLITESVITDRQDINLEINLEPENYRILIDLSGIVGSLGERGDAARITLVIEMINPTNVSDLLFREFEYTIASRSYIGHLLVVDQRHSRINIDITSDIPVSMAIFPADTFYSSLGSYEFWGNAFLVVGMIWLVLLMFWVVYYFAGRNQIKTSRPEYHPQHSPNVPNTQYQQNRSDEGYSIGPELKYTDEFNLLDVSRRGELVNSYNNHLRYYIAGGFVGFFIYGIFYEFFIDPESDFGFTLSGLMLMFGGGSLFAAIAAGLYLHNQGNLRKNNKRINPGLEKLKNYSLKEWASQVSAFLRVEKQVGIPDYNLKWIGINKKIVQRALEFDRTDLQSLGFGERWRLFQTYQKDIKDWNTQIQKLQTFLDLLKKYPYASYGNISYSVILDQLNIAQREIDRFDDKVRNFGDELKKEMGPFSDLERIETIESLPIRLRDSEKVIDYRFANLVKYVTVSSRTINYQRYDTKGFRVDDSGFIILTNKMVVFKGTRKPRKYDLNEAFDVEIFEDRLVLQSSNYVAKHYYEVSRSQTFQNSLRSGVIARQSNQETADTSTTQPTDSELQLYCIACGSSVNPENKFCMYCGTIILQKDGTNISHQKIKSIPEWNKLDGRAFEVYVAELLVKMGYQKVHNRPHVGDGGIDIEMESVGTLITSRIAVECKNWLDRTVGREVIQKLDSAIRYEGFAKGIVITTGKFSTGAIEYAASVNIFLMDKNKLEELILEY